MRMKRGELCRVIVMCMIRISYKLREEKRIGTNTTAKTTTDSAGMTTMKPKQRESNNLQQQQPFDQQG